MSRDNKTNFWDFANEWAYMLIPGLVLVIIIVAAAIVEAVKATHGVQP